MKILKSLVSVLPALVFMTASAGEGVKYRGIFVNDEDWSLRPWAIKHYGKSQQIGERAYGEIFKVMKADGLNLLWPAMHEGGYEFSSRPENLALAKANGITIGTSHCEPMLRNNCYLSKADKAKWSWLKNPEFLKEYWGEGVRRGADQDILWTIGMRGIHDGKMPDGKSTDEKKKILEEVFAAQIELLNQGIDESTDRRIQTLFCPYKEVLPIYNRGLTVPKGTTIMWTNDNFGYIRRLGGPQQEGYGGGIYWHVSYHGSPHGYIHLCTTPPAFMWYELAQKCWNNGVRDVWMVNAGDVFQAEILLDAYGRIAADPEKWTANAERELLALFASEKLKVKSEKVNEVVDHLEEYYNLGFNRKPEHMCVQWTTNLPASVKSDLLGRYHALLDADVALEASLDEALRDEYFRLVGFQARFLAYAGIIHLEGKDKAYAESILAPLHERWNRLDGGKWSGFWCDTIDERGGKRQPTTSNRWSSQMQWAWNEPADPWKAEKGVPRALYPATAYRSDVAEPEWLGEAESEKVKVISEKCNGGEWTRVKGLGTSGNAYALLPVKPGVGVGASLSFSLSAADKSTNRRIDESRNLILQFLPDYALWPGLKLGVNVVFTVDEKETEPVYVAVPKSDSNLGEHDQIRNQAVQDNFIRVELPIPADASTVKIVATDAGVVIDRVGVR